MALNLMREARKLRKEKRKLRKIWRLKKRRE
jgi:hypothetical protein